MISTKKWSLFLAFILLSTVLIACGDNTNTSAPAATTAASGGTAATTAAGGAATTAAGAATTAAGAATTAAGGAATTAAQAGGPKVELTMSVWAGVDEAKEFQAIIDQLNAKATNYHVTIQASPQEYFTKLQTGLASGTAPDLFWIDVDHLSGFADKGSLMDLTDMVKGDKNHPAANLDDYFKGALDAGTYKDKLYGLPWISQPLVLYVNLDMFKAAGVTPPTADWTWDDFLNAAKKLTVDGSGKTAADAGFDPKTIKQWGFTDNGADWPPTAMYIWQAGGQTITPDFKSSPIDSPEAVKAEQWYADLSLKYHVTPTPTQVKDQGFDSMFINGKVAMFVGGAADSLETRDGMKGQAQAFLVPKGPAGNRLTQAYIAFTSVNAKTKNKDAAYAALADITDGIQHWKVPVPRKSLSTKEAIQKIQPKRPAGSIDTIVAALPDAKSAPIFPNYAQWTDIWGTQFIDPLFRGKDTAENLAKKVRPQLEATLPK
ncbi:MAG TPA: sugar ABC transporter substrate-binding protein [Chloroflexia bacterium]|nr:sugar ABC transporter substrate-binding protein [Chloroflexia bacterium]